MAKVVDYIKESYDELVNKVSWPTWAELQNINLKKKGLKINLFL